MLLFPNEAFELIAEQTNIYAEQFLSSEKDNLKNYSIFSKWEPTSVKEIKAYVGLQIFMGLVDKSSLQIIGRF